MINIEDFLCAFFFDLFCVHFWHFLLPPILEVDISDIAIISGITNMMKSIILVINYTPQKTYIVHRRGRGMVGQDGLRADGDVR